VRKESKTASKALLAKTGKTLRGRLSILRDLRLNLVLFTHKVSSNSNTLSADQDGDGFFASIAYRAGIFAKVITAITTKVGFVLHAHKASELSLFVVPCLADVNTKGNCLVGGSMEVLMSL
jgi:hypothetical protein